MTDQEMLVLRERVARLEVAVGLITETTLGDLPPVEVAALTGESIRARADRLAAAESPRKAKKV